MHQARLRGAVVVKVVAHAAAEAAVATGARAFHFATIAHAAQSSRYSCTAVDVAHATMQPAQTQI